MAQTQAVPPGHGPSLIPPAEGDGDLEQLPPPPPPTVLRVDRAPDRPAAVTVETHSMSVQWAPCSVTVESPQIAVVEYLLTYVLSMQQLEGDSSQPESEAGIDDNRWSVQYMGPATYVQVKGLRPGRWYAVRVECQPVVSDTSVVLELAQPSPVLLVATPPTLPEAPAAPGLASRARNTLKFKWQEPDETGGRAILHYVLEMVPPPLGWEGPPNAEGWYAIYSGPERAHLVKRLQPGLRYASRVKAMTCIGESPYSAPCYTSTQATVPSTPAAPMVAAASETAITVRWEAPADNGAEISGYLLEVDDGRGNGFMPLHHGRSTSFQATGLQSGLVYRFRVRAENEAGRSAWSPVCEAVTAATVPSPPPPPNMLGSSQCSASITWKDVEFDGGSPVVGYEVELQPKCKAAKRGMPADWVLAYQGADKACTLGGLRAGCTYRVRVRAFNTRGPGNFSLPADVSTAPDVPEPPASLAPSACQQTGISMAWGKPEHDGGAALTAYRLEARLDGRLEELPPGAAAGSSEGRFEAVYVGPETSTEVSGLEPGCRYQFRVSAANRQGASVWTQLVTVDTRPGLPLTPDPPRAVATSAHTLALAWAAPYGQGAPVNSFILQACRLQALQAAALEQQRQRQQQQQQHVEGGSAPGAEEQHVAGGGGGLAPGAPMPGAVTPAAAASEAGPAAATPPEVPEGAKAGAPSATSALSIPPSEASNTASVQSDAVEATWAGAYHGAELGCTVRGLEPDTEYAVRLRACSAVGTSAWSAVEVFRTAPAAPTAPLGLDVLEVTSSSVVLAWHPPRLDHGSPLAAYQAEVAPVLRGGRAAAPHWRTAYQGSTARCTVAVLSPGREYQVRVRAGNACGFGPWTDPAIVITQPDVPDAPGAPAFSNRMGTSVRVKWAPPVEDNGAAVARYVLEAAPAGSGGPSFQEVYAGEAASCRVGGLAPGTEYLFRVRAANACGAGPYSPEASVSTTCAPPSPPTCVRATVDGGAAADAPPAVLVSWEPAPQAELQAACISYEIDAQPAAAVEGSSHKPAAGTPAGKSKEPKVCSGRATELLLTGLQPGAAYLVRVRGIGADGAGHGEWSEAAAVQLPAWERPPHTVPAGGSGDEDEAARARRRKSRGGGSAAEGQQAAKPQRGHGVLGTKTVAAKAMPKKPSVVSRVLKSCNVSPRLLKQMLTGLGLAASIVVFLVVIIAIIVISAKMK